ncbi:hypothetical protein HKX48_007882 [Thoreauomyces humboldtii]|nr:hypothetical protein HKX48_007882 [Thoreauomyces humboldtii]
MASFVSSKLLFALLAVLALHFSIATALPAALDKRATSTITYDKYNLYIDGKATMIFAGEFHAFRLPSPSLWLDILQKIKANGYNAVTYYFDWAYHTSEPGVYDFTGIRDMDRLLATAKTVGLYVIVRPGPYINAEITSGGFPSWLTTQEGLARSDALDYLASCDEWLSQINPIIAKYQHTTGGGTVILYQLENELAERTGKWQVYMQHLKDKARSDGITVPTFHNDKGRWGIWVPEGDTVKRTTVGPVELYGFDGYPAGGGCNPDGSASRLIAAPDWGIYAASPGAYSGSTASPNTPGFMPEFGGGWFDYYGTSGTYECTSVQLGQGFERVFYGTAIANRIAIMSIYMTFGGTNWGWMAAPVVYTSYDYGAAISEAREVRPKAVASKHIGYFVQAFPGLGRVEKGTVIAASSKNVRIYHNVNVDKPIHFFYLVHANSASLTQDWFQFPVATPDGIYTVPQSGSWLQLNGQDAKWVVANYDLAGQHLVYSTSEIMTYTSSHIVLHGRDAEAGETVLRFAPGTAAPTVTIVSGSIASVWNGTTGDLRLNYVHDDVAVVQVSGAGRPLTTILIADNTVSATLWRTESEGGPIIVRGPSLVRTAAWDNGSGALSLTGDTSVATYIEVWSDFTVRALAWNGVLLSWKRSTSGSVYTPGQLAGPVIVTLPDLATATWRAVKGSLEANVAFDDSEWIVATKTTTNSPSKPPAGSVVLTADDYGFHQGDVWYRGHFNSTISNPTLSVNFGGGAAGLVQAWIDGIYLGQYVTATGTPDPVTTGTTSFTIPTAQQDAGDHVLSIMVRPNGHNEDGGVDDAHKEGRGLISAVLPGATITWKIQGNLGEQTLSDPSRGVTNAGGLFGERVGWHLPGYPDAAWPLASVPARSASPGTSWYRTTFTLAVPADHDASIALVIGDETKPQSSANYRALIFVNGFNVGQYIAQVGPQHSFVLPNGVLNTDGANSLAIAVTSQGGPGNGLDTVVLKNIFTVRGGVPLELVPSPTYQDLKTKLQAAPY